jgi:hypothetical protein
MGAVMRKAQISAISAELDDWMRKATSASVAAAMNVPGDMGPIRSGTPIGRLTPHEWGWICSSAIWGWITTRSEQAVIEGWNVEHAIRSTGLMPSPWDAGAIAAILPKLAEVVPDLDWSKPIGDWPKDDVVAFLQAAFNLILRALEARDAVERQVAGAPTNADVTSQRMNGSIGNPRMTTDELGDLPPF